LHDDDGRVTLPGFYDGVKDLPLQEKAEWDALSFDGARFLGEVGLSVPAGESDRSVLEQITVRPTCDVSGIVGGYTGDGAKTVIAAQASAKVSFRLVAGQEPARVETTFRQFVAARLPADCKAAFQLYDVCPAIVVPSDSQPLTKARDALAEEWGRKAPAIGCGGSGPEVSHMKNILGIDSLLIGFGLEDDQIHSPNEKYDLRSFRKGIRSWIRILDALAK
jgi:acetylornithine deacetylase/succinyl-diaminopimelate desuccinylase-like protein